MQSFVSGMLLVRPTSTTDNIEWSWPINPRRCSRVCASAIRAFVRDCHIWQCSRLFCRFVVNTERIVSFHRGWWMLVNKKGRWIIYGILFLWSQMIPFGLVFDVVLAIYLAYGWLCGRVGREVTRGTSDDLWLAAADFFCHLTLLAAVRFLFKWSWLRKPQATQDRHLRQLPWIQISLFSVDLVPRGHAITL